MGTLDGKIALVTGGARGIGRAIALRFAREGADVAVADLNGEGAQSTAGEIEALGRKAVALSVDVRQLSQIQGMIDRVVQVFGRLDVVANNAGVVRVERFLDVTEQHWDFIMDVNAKAVFFVMQAAARQMMTQEAGSDGLRGRIINTASIAAKPGGRPMFAPYATSKAAVLSMTQSAAVALGPYITVNCVCPGVVDTAMWAQIDSEIAEIEGLQKGEAWAKRIAPIPLGRPQQPEDVAGVFAFLAGPDGGYITGQPFTVDGGIVPG
ncbi:MAG: glucose 1-dehydrogenase [Chloroflexi bacterium]|nr:glucose 1-dehydrogenase [Chloroflexota bacterium]